MSSSVNRELSYSFNHLGPWYDELISGIGGSVAKVPLNASVTDAARAMHEAPGVFPNVSYIVNGLGQRVANPQLSDIPSVVEKVVNPVSAIYPPESFDSFFGVDPATLGKYLLLATLALMIIGIGLFAILEPTIKSTAEEVTKAA